MADKKKITTIKGIPRKDYMREYMRAYYQRSNVKAKRVAEREERLLKDNPHLIDIARLDSKHRMVLSKKACDILGTTACDDIAIVQHGEYIKLIKLSDIVVLK